MKRDAPIVRTAIALGIISVLVLAIGDLKLPVELLPVAGQAPILLPGQTSPTDVDMTPAERSPEVQQLRKGTTFVPDPGEPAGAIKTYFVTHEMIRKAGRRIEVGLLPSEVDFDPYQLLREALAMRQRATMLYPTSRHAWDGLGDLSWQLYMRQHRSADLRQAVAAYTKVVDILTPRVQQGAGGHVINDFVGAVSIIANGSAALADRTSLDAFFGKLHGTTLWPFARLALAVALGSLNDSRADSLFKEELSLMPTGETLLEYVDYLWDQGRYQDALRIIDLKEQAKLLPVFHVVRGAILERLSRRDEARAEYQYYFDEVARRSKNAWVWPLHVSDRYRIAGSPLQQNIKFNPPIDRVPAPESILWRLLSPATAWADHLFVPCNADDWGCKAKYYVSIAVRGEVGCINPSSCVGTVGGQRAVAWNMRSRVFYGQGFRYCPYQEVCFNYARYTPLVPNPLDTAALSRRYYYVVDEGYKGLKATGITEAQRVEAEGIAYDVLVNGNVPDPNNSRCLAGYPTGDSCSAGCTQSAGYWGAIQPIGSAEFVAGDYHNFQSGSFGTCRWQELVPTGSPISNFICGSNCWTPSIPYGATCPKIGVLEQNYCGGPTTFLGPKWGNFFWRQAIRAPEAPPDPFPVPRTAQRDFNGDGKADILLRNDGGPATIWLMDGFAVIGAAGLQNNGPTWHVAGVGDFNDDRKADILWRNDTGAAAIWLMDGFSTLAGANLRDVGPTWHVAGVADFNSDGKADIFWRNDSGANAIWFMNGLSELDGANLRMVDPSWKVAGLADFNGDGQADILWRNDSGATAIWLMDGFAELGGVNLPMTDPAWKVGGLGDFNGDGKADILWRHDSGANSIWFMDGLTVISGATLPATDPSWKVADIADFDGDGQPDILWRNTSTGEIPLWLMYGTSIMMNDIVTTVSLDWKIANSP